MSATRKKPDVPESDTEAELIYRFPLSGINLEIVPDNAVSFGIRTLGLRLNWQKGKTVFAYIETSALRPIAEATIDGQCFPIFLTRHEKRGMGKVALFGERNGAKITALVEGREDRLHWSWKVEGDVKIESLTLHLPFGAGGAQTIHAPDSDRALALWRHGIAATVASPGAGTLQTGERGIALRGEGCPALAWEIRFAPARTEPEVRDLLVAHLAELGDLSQEVASEEPLCLFGSMQAALVQLTDPKRLAKPALDRLHFREGDERVAGGEGTDASRAACALLLHHYLTGDDALRRQARLLAHGLCDFQVNEVESPHWGAFWDAMNAERKLEDRQGGESVSVISSARAAQGLYVLNAHFETELMLRSALASAQWLLLKTDINGLPIAERFEVGGPRIPGGSPWAAGETMSALVATFRVIGNETYLKAALRSIASLRSRVAEGALRPEGASTESLAACIEGVLLVSREYENDEMIAFARQLGGTLRARRLPDGWVSELPERTSPTPMGSALAAGRAALALARVDDDIAWPLMALRVLRAAAKRIGGDYARLSIADLTALASLPLGLLLTLGARPRGGEADRDKLQIKRGWQTFEADPAAREYIQVTLPDGSPVDYIAMVCQASLQVQITVIAPPSVTEVSILKNQKAPYVRNLLTGSYEQRYALEPLGDGKEARYGVFIADT